MNCGSISPLRYGSQSRSLSRLSFVPYRAIGFAFLLFPVSHWFSCFFLQTKQHREKKDEENWLRRSEYHRKSDFYEEESLQLNQIPWWLSLYPSIWFFSLSRLPLPILGFFTSLRFVVKVLVRPSNFFGDSCFQNLLRLIFCFSLFIKP